MDSPAHLSGAGAERRLLRFDDFLVDPKSRLLWRDEEPVPLTPKVFAVLLALLRKPGEVVTKEELIETVWAGSYVTEANLTQSVSSLRKALGERANDRRYIVTIPGQGYCFAARITEVFEEPPSQFLELPPPVDEERRVPEEPSGERPAAAPPPPVPPQEARRPSRLRPAVAALLVLGIAAALGLARLARAPLAVPPEATVPAHRPTIAMLGFTNLSGEADTRWLSTAIPEMLATELAFSPGIRVIPGENVASARLSLDSRTLDAATLAQLHKSLGADLLVTGSYLLLGGGGGGRRIRLDLRVIQAPGGETRASLAEVGTEAELFPLVERAGARLRQELGLSDPSSEEERSQRALLPKGPAAARLYAEGLAKLRSFDPAGALGPLQQAARSDPSSAVIRSALAEAWAALGYDNQAVADARQAVELARSLPREERLAIEARFHEVRREWSKASEIYHSLWTFYPDDLEYGLHLAADLSEAGRSTEALATVAALRRLPFPEGEDPRIDLAEARAAKRLADLKTERRAAEAAAAKGASSGQSLVVAQALLLQGEVAMRTGDPARAMRLYEEARLLFERAGNRLEVVRALTHLGAGLHEQGDLAGAQRKHTEALAIAQSLGSQSGVALQKANLGLIQQRRGDMKQALASLREARSLHARLGDKVFEARDLNALGTLHWSQGELAEAREAFEKVLALSRANGNRRDEARALNNLGSTLARQGRVREARELHEQAFGILDGLGEPRLASSALADSAGALVRLGEIPEARRRLDRALDAKLRIKDRIGAAEVLGSISALDYARGDLASASRLVGQQLRSARELGVGSLLLQGLRRRADLQRAAGDLPGARRSLEEALREAVRMGEEPVAAVKLGLAGLSLAEGRFDEAGRLAREAAAWYGPRRMPGDEGQAWATAAESELRQGRAEEARVAAARARALVEKSGDRELLLLVAPRLARVDEASGEESRAVQDLSRAVEQAGRLGFVTAGLEARLTLGEIRGERKLLEDVRREAESRGFRRLAREAARALEEHPTARSGSGGPAGQTPSSASSGFAASPWSVSSVQSR